MPKGIHEGKGLAVGVETLGGVIYLFVVALLCALPGGVGIVLEEVVPFSYILVLLGMVNEVAMSFVRDVQGVGRVRSTGGCDSLVEDWLNFDGIEKNGKLLGGKMGGGVHDDKRILPDMQQVRRVISYGALGNVRGGNRYIAGIIGCLDNLLFLVASICSSYAANIPRIPYSIFHGVPHFLLITIYQPHNSNQH